MGGVRGEKRNSSIDSHEREVSGKGQAQPLYAGVSLIAESSSIIGEKRGEKKGRKNVGVSRCMEEPG